MPIRPLSTTTLETVVAALTAAFADYFVKLPDSVDYWRERYIAARVDWDLSFGVWEDDQLVAFIVQGIDHFQGHKTAFNTGTGVLPSHRGRGLVDALYAHALPQLRAAGVTRCTLEVITQNARAIRVYERIGFAVMRRVQCFRGTLQVAADPMISVRLTPLDELAQIGAMARALDAWDNTDAAIIASRGAYVPYIVLQTGQLIGGFAIHPQTNYVPRLEIVATDRADHWELLLRGVAQISPDMRMNNIDATRTTLVGALLAAGLTNPVDQFEMAMPIA